MSLRDDLLMQAEELSETIYEQQSAEAGCDVDYDMMGPELQRILDQIKILVGTIKHAL